MTFQGFPRRPAIVTAIAAGVLLLGALGWVFVGRDWLAAQERARIGAALRANPQTAEAYAMVERQEDVLQKDPNNLASIITIGNSWKQIFDFTGDPRHIAFAIETYERAFTLGTVGRNNTIVLRNLATAHRLAGHPEDAEPVLERAIEVDPGDVDNYLALISVLRFDLKRDNEQIIDVYKKGLDQLIVNAPLVQSLAMYLEDIGRIRDALTYYRILADVHPVFEEKIRELEQRLEKETSP